MVNIHPALLPKFGGKGMFGMNVHQAVHEAGEEETGITIHFVNEQYDDGAVVFQAQCAIEPGDSPETIAKKVLKLEHEHFPKVIEKLVTGL
jgi:phosphoribosylglycinamide formyltransferase-1